MSTVLLVFLPNFSAGIFVSRTSDGWPVGNVNINRVEAEVVAAAEDKGYVIAME